MVGKCTPWLHTTSVVCTRGEGAREGLDRNDENMVREVSSTPIVWSIAGFDPSSGAGITADLMTFAAHGLFGCSAPTALTAQSTLGVKAIEAVPEEFLARTLATLDEDLPPAGIKIGMLCSPGSMRVVAEFLRTTRHEAAQSGNGTERVGMTPVVVLDPVLRSSSGRELYPLNGLDELEQELLPHVDIITPNWSELAALTGSLVNSLETAEQNAKTLIAAMPHLHVVATGGDQGRPVDLLVSPDLQTVLYEGEHIASKATHGTGCAFSSSLLAYLVRGLDLPSAVRAAKNFVSEAIRRAPQIGHGKGPMNLLWNRPPATEPPRTDFPKPEVGSKDR